MSPDQRTFLLRSLRVQIELIEELAPSSRLAIQSSRTLILNFLARLECVPAPGVMDHLAELDLAAVYNHHQQMIFLSPNHLVWMTYSIEDLHCRPWYDLFGRDEEVEKILLARARQVATSQIPLTILNSDVPPHVIRELHTPSPRWGVCYSKFYSTIFKNGSPAGFVASNQDRVRAHQAP